MGLTQFFPFPPSSWLVDVKVAKQRSSAQRAVERQELMSGDLNE